MWNLFGLCAPLFIAIFCIPFLIKGLGKDRFGILTLAWAVVGYFSLFDLGMGRALTKLVAEKLGAGLQEEIPKLIWTALVLMGVLGVISVIVVTILVPVLVQEVLKIPKALQNEALTAFYLLSFSIPVVMSSTGLRGVLEAYQRFDLTNMIRVPLGMYTFLGPLAVMPFSKNLFFMVAVLIIGRFISWGIHLFLCLRIVPSLSIKLCYERTMVRPLITFGSWMTVTNIISPLMVYMDRFFIGALISTAAVTYYSTPSEVIARLGVIPNALIGVLFPAFSTTVSRSQADTASLFGRGINYIILSLFPLTLIVVTIAHDGMALLFGLAFAIKSAFVLQCLAVGLFINGVAKIPFVLVQGLGYPDLTAKIHILELPFYLFLLWWLLGAYGIKGAAVAWVIRVSIDALILFIITQKLVPTTKPYIMSGYVKIIIASGFFIIAGYIADLLIKCLFIIVMITSFIVVSWIWLLTTEEREIIKRVFHLPPVEDS
jgi:O-antigen/teichoic acid export membrane protein